MRTQRPPKNIRCVECGTPWHVEKNHPWPRTCEGCGATTWMNPRPVGVLIVPLLDHPGHVLAVRRAIQPGLGQLALPSGYLESHEPWRNGCARELQEETGITIDPHTVTLLHAETPPTNLSVLLLFASTHPQHFPKHFEPNDEVSELAAVPTDGSVRLAFDLHNEVLARYQR